jgi:hypothetical protein
VPVKPMMVLPSMSAALDGNVTGASIFHNPVRSLVSCHGDLCTGLATAFTGPSTGSAFSH